MAGRQGKEEKREKKTDLFPWTSLLPLFGGIMAFNISTFFAPKHVSDEFYSTCAQIIPVFLLAIALEARVLRFGLGADSVLFEGRETALQRDRDRLRAVEEELGQVEAPAADVQRMQKKIDEIHQDHEKAETRTKYSATAWKVMRSVYAGATALVLLLGEMVSLLALADERYDIVTPGLPFGSVTLGFFTVVLIAAIPNRP